MTLHLTAAVPAHQIAAAPLPISAATAARRQRTGALLLDIRPQVARHQGSIADAVVVDPNRLGEPSLETAELNRERDIIVCSISTKRAMQAAELLTRQGYRHVCYLAGGYTAWRSRHGEL